MPFPLRFHRLAALEARQAERYYRRHATDPRVAERFRLAVDETAARIADEPASYPFLIGPYRSLRVRRFPYRLIYLVEVPDLVLILAVAHTGRRPGYWQRRQRNL